MTDHTLAELFPLMEETELKSLSDDIKTNGQRAMVAAKLARLEKGRTESNAPIGAFIPTQEEAAKTLNVSRRSVQRAKAVLADPVESKAVESGVKTVAAAAKAVQAKKQEKEVIRDDTGYAIPASVLPLWNRRDEVKTALKAISNARCAVKEASEKDDLLYRPVSLNSILATLNTAYTNLQVAVPYAVCPVCQGQAPDECTLCKGRGIIGKFLFDRAVPDELKAIRAKSCVLK